MIRKGVLRLPTKALRHFFPKPPNLAELSNQAIDDYFKENPL